MARSFAGGTDQVQWTVPTVPPNIGCAAYWLRTTQTAVNTAVMTHWSSSSRNGWGMLMNNTSNKLTAQGYATTTPARISLVSTTSVNDGAWHHIAFNYNRSLGGACALYVDGVLEASGTSSSTWTTGGTNFWIATGDDSDPFWASLVGEVAEVGHWFAQLDAEEIATLAKGVSPSAVRPAALAFHAPLVRETHDIRGGLTGNATGGSASAHPRVIRGMI